jgi:hypothetical protein
MDESHKPDQSGSWIKWFVVVALLLVSLSIVLWLLPGSSSKIQARLEALKKADYPVTAQDLDKMYPPIPDDQNSVVIYQKAFSHYLPLPEEHDNWPIVSVSKHSFRTQPLPPDVKQGISEFVNQNENTLALLHQAAGIEKGYYDNGLKNGFANSVRPPLLQIRENAQLLALATILRAEDQQPGAATTLILDSLGLPRSLERDPMLVSQLNRNAVVGLSCSSLELTLNKTSLSDDQLRRLDDAFREAELSNGLKQSLISERCLGISFYNAMKTNSFAGNVSLSDRFESLYYRVRYYREGDFLFYLDTMENYLAATDAPYPKRLQLVDQLNTSVVNSRESERAFGILLAADWKGAFLMAARTHSQLVLSETALAVERYRLAHRDQLPPVLQDLVPAYLAAVPADPFDGKPLRYNRLPKGYLLYSIGEDGVDNGGEEWDPQKKTGDLTFTVER